MGDNKTAWWITTIAGAIGGVLFQILPGLEGSAADIVSWIGTLLAAIGGITHQGKLRQ